MWVLVGLLFLVSGGCTTRSEWVFKQVVSLHGKKPVGIAAVDDSLWISIPGNNQLLRLGPNGNVKDSTSGFSRPMHIYGRNGILYVPEYTTDKIKQVLGTKISHIDKFAGLDAPSGVAADANHIVVADFYNHRLLVSKDEAVTVIGQKGHGQGELFYPTDVEISDGLVYVADAYNHRVQVFQPDGRFVGVLGDQAGIRVATGITVDAESLYVADFENDRLLVFAKDGKIIQIIDKNLSKPTDVIVAGNTMYVTNFGNATLTILKK